MQKTAINIYASLYPPRYRDSHCKRILKFASEYFICNCKEYAMY